MQLQGVDPGSYAAMAAAEGTVEVVLPAERGDILDRNGEPLADSVDGLMVVADPALTAEDAPAIAWFLAQRLSVDYIDTLARLRERGSRFEYIARRVPSTLAGDVLNEAEARGIEGLSTRRDPLRTYPAQTSPPTWLGFMGTDEAFGGIEQVFDTYLSGRDGTARYEVGGGNRIPLGTNEVRKAVDGANLTTTIDRDLQWYTQRVLRAAVLKARGDSGIAVIMDSRTGEILADADYPTFDAADPADSPTPTAAPASINLALRARLGGEGAHDLVAHRRRSDHRAHQVHGPRQPGPSRPGHQRLLPARQHPADPGGDPRQVLQHRHGAGGRSVQAGRASVVPHQVRTRADAPRSDSMRSRRASCPTPRCGPTRPRTASRSASRSP